MKNVLAIILLSIFMQSCMNPCKGIDCEPDERFMFNFFSNQSNENLVFGPNPILDKNGIQIYYMEGGEKNQEPFHYHSNRFIAFIPQVNQPEYFVEALGKIDTLSFTYDRSEHHECCGSIKLIPQIMVNNVIMIPDSTGIINLFR